MMMMMMMNRNLGAVFEGLFKASSRHVYAVVRDGADGFKRVVECSDSVEKLAGINPRLIERSDGARLGITICRLGLVHELVQNAKAA